MMFRLNASVRSWKHRLVSLCVVAALLAGIVPLPLGSSVTTSKDTSTPFPCQYHRCGCRSAEQCWKKCCCFTNQQKLAWAKKHGVTPPDYVIAAASGERLPDVNVSKKCCATAGRTCGSKKYNQSQAVECNEGNHAEELKSAATISKTEVSDNRYVIGALAQQCRGESSFWNSLPWSILPPTVEVSGPRDVMIDEWTFSSDARRDVFVRPPVPPPRAV